MPFISASFAVGMRDKSHFVPSTRYRDLIKDIGRKYVVLFDVENERGWLVDGASALVHLARASLKDDGVDIPEDENASQDYDISTAMDFLRNERYLNLEISTDDLDVDMCKEVKETRGPVPATEITTSVPQLTTTST